MTVNMTDRFYHLAFIDNDYREPHNDENIEDDISPSRENELLRSPESDNVENREDDLSSSTSNYDMGVPWDQWTEKQKDVMMEHINYYLDSIDTFKQKIVEINKCWATGPIPKSQVKKVRPLPKSNINFIYTEKKQRKKVLITIKNFWNI